MFPSSFLPAFLLSLAALRTTNAYWLMGMGFIATERMDPIVNPNAVSGHVHSIMGGSNFGFTTSTAHLRQSKCTSTPIPQDKSNYWFPHLYFHPPRFLSHPKSGQYYLPQKWDWLNLLCPSKHIKDDHIILFSGRTGTEQRPKMGKRKCLELNWWWCHYLFSDTGKTTAFPDDFRMLSGDPTLRTENTSSPAQQAVSFLCLDFSGSSTRFTGLPPHACPSGIRAQINMPSCWDGKNVDSPTHNTHVAFPSGGPDSGTCSDPRYPITLPRIFIEVYWNTGDFDKVRSQAKNPNQPFVFSYGDATGYGYHADFANGWDAGVLQHAVEKCNCNPYGDPTCCAQAGIFDFKPKGSECYITPQVDETVTGMLAKLPGNNPVLGPEVAVNGHVVLGKDTNPPGALYPPQAFTSKAQMEGACKVGGGGGCTKGAVPGAGSVPSAPASVPASTAASSSASSASSASHTSSSTPVAYPSGSTSSGASSSMHAGHSSASPSGAAPSKPASHSSGPSSGAATSSPMSHISASSSASVSKSSGSSAGGPSVPATASKPSTSSSVPTTASRPHASAPASSAPSPPSTTAGATSSSYSAPAPSKSTSASSPHGSNGGHSNNGGSGSHGGHSNSGHAKPGSHSGHHGHANPGKSHSGNGHSNSHSNSNHSHSNSGHSDPNSHEVHSPSNHAGTCSAGSGKGRKHHAGSYRRRGH